MMIKHKRIAVKRKVLRFFFKTVALFLFCVIILFMRIDRLLCELNMGSRNEVKQLLKKGLISVNGEIVRKPETKVDELSAVVSCQGKEYRYRKFVYYMMNKPAGTVSAREDSLSRTVLDVLKECLSEQCGGNLSGIPLKDISPVGRLDKDTVGLLLLTNDGEMAHRLLSPKKHVIKQYYVETDLPVTKEAADALRHGVDIGEEKLTREAGIEILDEKKCLISITEGKYHQVKRMFQALGLQVMYLKRLSMGSLRLDENLPEGGVRELTREEVLDLC
jgi:16S rRNA pseudouridine516 synthase